MKKNNSPIIRLEKVSKSFVLSDQYKVTALDNVSITINHGDFAAIIGPSGSGKSTLMHIMSLLDPPTSGKVYFQATQTSKFSEKDLAQMRNQKIGFVFQQFNLLRRTSALENVQLPLIYSGVSRNIRRKRAQKMLTRIGLGSRLLNTPNQLSGGQQQRVAIARALINNPQVIFADEPTGNLDSNTGQDIMRIFSKLHQEGATIILVTHEKAIAKYAQRIITIKDGRITSDD